MRTFSVPSGATWMEVEKKGRFVTIRFHDNQNRPIGFDAYPDADKEIIINTKDEF